MFFSAAKYFISQRLLYFRLSIFFQSCTPRAACSFYTDTVGKNPYKDCPPQKTKLRRHFNPFKTKSRLECRLLSRFCFSAMSNLRIFSPVSVGEERTTSHCSSMEKYTIWKETFLGYILQVNKNFLLLSAQYQKQGYHFTNCFS